MHRFSKEITTTLRSLQQRKLRSFLSITGVVCGVMAVLTMVSIGEGAKNETLRKIERLGINNIYIRPLQFSEDEQRRAVENLSRGLTVEDAQALHSRGRTISEVAVFHELETSLIESFLEFTPQIATCSQSYFSIYGLHLKKGRIFSFLDIKQKKPVCIVGSAVAEQLGFQGKIGGKIRIADTIMRIVGILGRQGDVDNEEGVLSLRNHDEMILVPSGLERYLQISLEEVENTNISEIIVKIKDSEMVESGVAEVNNIMSRLHFQVDDYDVIVPMELLEQSNETRRIFNTVLVTIAAISLLVGGIGIMNIMLATVTERTREIGIRRAVGARQRDIGLQFLLEALVLTVVGGGIGVVLGIAASICVSLYAHWPTAITPFAVLLPLVLSCLTGLFFGWYPATMAAKMHPIKALKSE